MMDIEAVAALRALADCPSNRTKVARLRELYGEIEAARSAGVTMVKIVESLNKSGLEITYAQLQTMIHRFKQEAKKTNIAVPVVPANVVLKESVAQEMAASSEAIVSQQGNEAVAKAGDEFDGLTAHQRREKRASQFIKSEITNPLLKHLMDKNSSTTQP